MLKRNLSETKLLKSNRNNIITNRNNDSNNYNKLDNKTTKMLSTLSNLSTANEWWLLFDSMSKRFYYYSPSKNKTAWHLPQMSSNMEVDDLNDELNDEEDDSQKQQQTQSSDSTMSSLDDSSSDCQHSNNKSSCPVVPLANKLINCLNQIKATQLDIDYCKIFDKSMLSDLQESMILLSNSSEKPSSSIETVHSSEQQQQQQQQPVYLNFLLKNLKYSKYINELINDTSFYDSFKSMQTANKLNNSLHSTALNADTFSTLNKSASSHAEHFLDSPTQNNNNNNDSSNNSNSNSNTTTLNRKRRLQPRTNPNYINVDLINRNDGSLIKNTYIKLQDLSNTSLEKTNCLMSAKNTLTKQSKPILLKSNSNNDNEQQKQVFDNVNNSNLQQQQQQQDLNSSLSKAALLLLTILNDKSYDLSNEKNETTSINKMSSKIELMKSSPSSNISFKNNESSPIKNTEKLSNLSSSSITLVNENNLPNNNQITSTPLTILNVNATGSSASCKKSTSINVKTNPNRLKNFSSYSTSLQRRNTEINKKKILN